MTTPDPPLAAIVLAAGESTRMGQPKALLPWGGVPLVRHQVDLLAAQPAINQVVVIVGSLVDEVRAALDGTPARVVANPRFREGRAPRWPPARVPSRAAPPESLSSASINRSPPTCSTRWWQPGAPILKPCCGPPTPGGEAIPSSSRLTSPPNSNRSPRPPRVSEPWSRDTATACVPYPSNPNWPSSTSTLRPTTPPPNHPAAPPHRLNCRRPIAQLEERLNGIEEVVGSNPIGSTPPSSPRPL